MRLSYVCYAKQFLVFFRKILSFRCWNIQKTSNLLLTVKKECVFQFFSKMLFFFWLNLYYSYMIQQQGTILSIQLWILNLFFLDIVYFPLTRLRLNSIFTMHNISFKLIFFLFLNLWYCIFMFPQIFLRIVISLSSTVL